MTKHDDPKNVLTPQQIFDLARRSFDAGNYSDAESRCQELLARNPNASQALAMLGTIRHANGDTGEGIRLIERALHSKLRSSALHIFHWVAC